MRVSTVVAGPRTIVQASIVNSQTLVPATAFTDIVRLSGVDIHGSATRVTATGQVDISGTTNTARVASLRLVHGAANVVLCGGDLNLPNNEAAAGVYGWFFALQFIILTPPALATDEFAIQWSTGANTTANVDGTDQSHGGVVLNVEELTAASSSVGPDSDTLIFDSVVATDPIGILTAVGASFANALDIDPNIQIVDVSIAGGGAGNVYMVDLIYRLPQLIEDVPYPRLIDQLMHMGFGSEARAMVFSSTRWLDAFPGATLNFWSHACSGDGAAWVTLYIFEPAPVPDLLFARSGEPDPAGASRFTIRVADITPQTGALSRRVALSKRSASKEPEIFRARTDTVRVKAPELPQRYEASPRKKGN